jgi:hypothetical protein
MKAHKEESLNSHETFNCDSGLCCVLMPENPKLVAHIIAMFVNEVQGSG